MSIALTRQAFTSSSSFLVFIVVIVWRQNHVMGASQIVRHQAPLFVDSVTSPTSATSASLSDILVTKRSSWPRVVLHPSTGVDVPAPGWSTPARRAVRLGRRTRSTSPHAGRSVDDSWTTKHADTTPTSPVDGATVVRCLDSCDKILLRHSTTIT